MRHLPIYKYILALAFTFSALLLPNIAHAETSPFRSASWVDTDGSPAYSNVSGCQVSGDGLYCSRSSATSFANLYFGSFGTLQDFGIPQGSSINKLHVRVTGKSTDGQIMGVNSAKNQKPLSGSCQLPSDLWNMFLGSSITSKEVHTYTSANGLTNCITANNINEEKLTFTLRRSSGVAWSADIDNFEIAFDYSPPTNAWVGVGNLNIPRYSHPAVLLNNGKVLIIGGERTGLTVRQVEAYDPATKQWSHVSLLNTARKMLTANLIPSDSPADAGNVLVAAGLGDSGMLNSAEVYNTSNSTWTNVGNLNSARIFHASSVLSGGKVLVTGGSVNTSVTSKHNSTEVYDPGSKTWSLKGSLNTARGFHQQVTFKDAQGKEKVMVIGGVDGSGIVGASTLSSTEIYDPTSNVWTFGPNMNSARSDFGAVVLHDGRILVVGGNTTGDSEVYNPATNAWTVYSTAFPFKTGATITVLGSGSGYKVLAAGGSNSELRAQLFDPVTNTWNTTTSMNTPRSRFTLTTLQDGNVIAAGGISEGGQTFTSELYRPPQVLGVSVTPTPSVSPTPAPFLDLPWEQGKDSFDQNAFSPNSWFDHEYPLQNIACCVTKVRIYTGKEVDDYYRSHSGYDWGSLHGIYLHTPVLAAASGTATFVPESKSGGAGNLIKIDHKNGYQTWYEHLHWDEMKADHGLIVDTEGESIDVTQGQQIGMVGMSGNTNGPHIHFSVFKDENNNGTFTDDYPYGLVDPLGWEGDKADPWTEYTNADETKHGANSFSLYLARTAPAKTAIPTSGGTLTTDKINIGVPSGASAVPFTLKIEDGPFESSSASLRSATPTFYLTALNSLGEKITQFLNPITITYSYEDANLLNINEDTLKLYHYNESTKQWEQLPSTLNKANKTITGQTLGFSQFAVMGELKDLVAPMTNHNFEGTQGNENWFRSNVNVTFNAVDNNGGLGIEYALYKLDDNDWLEYDQTITVEDEGNHTLKYKSIDMAYNIEEENSVNFTIDKTAPVTTASVSGTEGLDGWYKSDVIVILNAEDEGEVFKTEYSLDGGQNFVEYNGAFSVSAEGVTEVLYRSVDRAGNVEGVKSLSVKIDSLAPSSLVYTTGAFGENGWFTSDVVVSLNAVEGGSGYEKSYYSFDNVSFVEYVDPLTIDSEGVTKLYYYSTDKAGNEESAKVFSVKIDKTAPEVEILYDIPALDIRAKGKDSMSTAVSTIVTIANGTGDVSVKDQAGNTLKVVVKEKEKGKNARLSVISLQYNGGEVITVNKNTFSVKYDYFDATTNTIKKFDQDWKVNDVSKLTLSYSQDNDMTSVKNRLADGTVESIQVAGKKFLKVTSNKGVLVSSY